MTRIKAALALLLAASALAGCGPSVGEQERAERERKEQLIAEIRESQKELRKSENDLNDMLKKKFGAAARVKISMSTAPARGGERAEGKP